MSLLEHPETRESLKRFTWEQLAKDIHVELFGAESKDSIDRRLQLKIWKELEARYAKDTEPTNGIDKKKESETPLIDALLSDEPEVEAAQPEVEEVPEPTPEPLPEPTLGEQLIEGMTEAVAHSKGEVDLKTTEVEVEREPVNAALAWATGEPVPPPPPTPEKPAKAKKAPKGEPKSRRQGLSEELIYKGLSRACKKCGKEGMHKCCPQCDAKAKGIQEVEEVFGFRPTKAKKGEKSKVRIIQTWCRACRRRSSSTSKKAAATKKSDDKKEESSPTT
jgi:hypothetical protein